MLEDLQERLGEFPAQLREGRRLARGFEACLVLGFPGERSVAESYEEVPERLDVIAAAGVWGEEW
jgi:hypothetical protein